MRFEVVSTVAAVIVILSCNPLKETASPPIRLEPGVERIASEALSSLSSPVTLRIFRGGDEGSAGEGAQVLIDHLAKISPMINVETADISSLLTKNEGGASHGPVIEMIGTAPGTLRYYGYPQRNEVLPFLEGILTASDHHADLPTAARVFVSNLSEEVWIRIFTTPD